MGQNSFLLQSPEVPERSRIDHNNHTIQFGFMWTNSLLMNLIPEDLLLAMDNTVTVILYSDTAVSWVSAHGP